MSSIKLTYDLLSKKPAHVVKEDHIEYGKCQGLLDGSKITVIRVATAEKSSAVHRG